MATTRTTCLCLVSLFAVAGCSRSLTFAGAAEPSDEASAIKGPTDRPTDRPTDQKTGDSDAGPMAGAAADGVVDKPATAPAPPDDTGPEETIPDAATAAYACAATGGPEQTGEQPAETCYAFAVHGVSDPADVSPFVISSGESYHEWYYDVPWPRDAVGVRFETRLSLPDLHIHWLAFSVADGAPPGTVSTNVTGTTLGRDAELIGGWAYGGCDFQLPPDVGMRLPADGTLMVQWHMLNATGSKQSDQSAAVICTGPASSRTNLAAMTFLGTEDLNGPLGMPVGVHEFSGSCQNMTDEPITIVALRPNMHKIGKRMRSEVQRAGEAMLERVFDEPFEFDRQDPYLLQPRVVLFPGDVISSTCTFDNDTGQAVSFGQSAYQEFCYQFAYSYPAGALSNATLSLVGATNTCWRFGE